MSGSLFSPTAPAVNQPDPSGSPAAPPANASPPSDNRPAPSPDVMLPGAPPPDTGLPDILMTPEEQAQARGEPASPQEGQPPPQQEGQQPPQEGQQQGNPADRAPPGYVPAAALAEARGELKQQRQAVQRLEQQLQAFLGAAAARGLHLGQPEQPQQPQLPDVNVDPIGHFQARAEMLERQLQQALQGVGQMSQAQQQQLQQQQFLEAYQAQAAQFAQANPEFVPAYQAWFGGLVLEAQAAGLAPQEALAWARSQEMAVAARAMQQEVNPAERILAMAKVRGWKPQPPQQPPPQPPQAPQGYQPPAVDPNAAFAALERGAAAARSVGTNGVPGLPPASLTAQRLAEIPMADFERVTEGDAWERLMRGLGG